MGLKKKKVWRRKEVERWETEVLDVSIAIISFKQSTAEDAKLVIVSTKGFKQLTKEIMKQQFPHIDLNPGDTVNIIVEGTEVISSPELKTEEIRIY